MTLLLMVVVTLVIVLMAALAWGLGVRLGLRAANARIARMKAEHELEQWRQTHAEMTCRPVHRCEAERAELARVVTP